MGKKSRRNKAPKAARERRDEPEEEPEFAEDRLIRYREPEEYNIDKGAAQFLAHEHFKAIGGENDGFEWGEGELETMSEFMYLVVFPAHKQLGFEAALRVSRRWPRFKPHWHRVRRRVCDYCWKRNDLSEPRLWVCAGCGVARYCDKDCQENDFSHHAKSCQVLARRWDGVGPIPTQLFHTPNWEDPAVVPSALARERLDKHIAEFREFLNSKGIETRST